MNRRWGIYWVMARFRALVPYLARMGVLASALSVLTPALCALACRAQSSTEPLSLMPPASLAGFRRVPLDPLASKPVWQVSADGALLVIDGAGAKEMLLSEKELGDGVLHIEWRFVKASGEKPVYNGGVYVRTSLDGKSWVQLQVAQQDKPPISGDLIAQVPSSSARIEVFQAAPSPARPVGEWNEYDITTRGKSIELSVNGKHTVTWPECPLLRGHVGLQAEGALLEVRSFRFTPL